MPLEPITKSSSRGGIAPNLLNYGQARAAFSWEEARSELDGLPDGRGLNIAHDAVDRHAAGPLRDKAAIRWLGKDGAVRDFSFAQLRDLTNRFANAPGRLGVGKGDRVYALMGRVPELYITALGALKNRSVFWGSVAKATKRRFHRCGIRIVTISQADLPAQ
jgi:acetyl-CoA synthetase